MLGTICSIEGNTVQSLRALRTSRLNIFRVADLDPNGGFAFDGRLEPLIFPPPDSESQCTLTTEQLACRYIMQEAHNAACGSGGSGSGTGAEEDGPPTADNDLSWNHLHSCCRIAPSGCQVDVFGARPPFNFPADALSARAVTASSSPWAAAAAGGGADPAKARADDRAGVDGSPVEVISMPSDKVTWDHPPMKISSDGKDFIR